MRQTRFRTLTRARLRACLAAVALLTASAGVVVAQAGSASAATTTLHVAANGTGTACSSSQPCSLAQAKTTVRALNDAMTSDITIEVANGTYRLTAPLTFTSADSGTGGHTVTWKAALGARPVLTGAVKATGWTLHDSGKNIWQAKVGTGFDTRQLYVNGALATRARYGISRSDLTATNTGYTFTNTSLNFLNGLANPGRTEIHGIGSFTDRYSPVAGISNGTITMNQPAWNDNTFGYDTLTKPFRAGPLYIENAYEFLDTAGEWYLDNGTGTLYYKPASGQNMSTVDVEVPKLQSLIQVGGTYASPATHIAFSGLQFSGTSWLSPSSNGYASQQTGAYLSGTWDRPSDALTSCQSGCQLFQATRPHWSQMPAAVQVSAADHITFTGNRFSQLGQDGLGIGNDANAHATGVGLGADTITATGNVFTQDAGGGIVVGGLQADAHHPSDTRMTDQNITLSNNLIHDVALDYRDMTAVLATYVSGATVTHNEVYNLPYSGINIGYGWGANDAGGSQDYVNRGLYNYQPVYTTATTAKNNHITDNLIHDVMQQMNDGGCMYTLSASPGSTLERNYCHDNKNNIGIYHDEGSRNFTDKNNVFRNIGSWSHENASSTNNTGALTLTDNWVPSNWSNITNGNRGDVVGGTVLVTNGDWPSGARTVMDNAGIQPAYRPLNTDPVTAPYSAYSSTPANTGQSGGRFTITDAGADNWGAGGHHDDAYGTVYQAQAAVNGTSVTARVDNVDNSHEWAKAGVVLRNSLTGSGSSPGYAVVAATPSHGVTFQWDSTADGYLDQSVSTASTVTAPVWVRLTRNATQVSAYYSTDGVTFTQVGSTVTLPSMAATQDAGVIHTAHSTATVGSATFSNLQIVTPPYKAYSSIPAAVDQHQGVTSLSSAGIDVWVHDDDYAAAYRPGAAGSTSTVTVRVDSQDNPNGWSKAGLMLRNNITGAGSSTGYIVLAVTPSHGVNLVWDSNSDGYLDTSTTTGTATAPVWLRLTRNGTSVTGFYSTNGTTWISAGTATPSGANTTQDAGMFFTAHSGTPGTASLSQFTIS
ncbi:MULTISPECIES: right-handed parallel beta-helix repeat-containing protein [unclassified Streptomyces]|uniref:right-handed parallel beta-helix repeat-containing protein n=1 Tax=unclassified Streptomyces TaxID=2593676 RepID=UPI00225A2EA0|nr:MULTISPECIES: right-handed parallel beta-helix repeat-containing protein [unclassified Streptomyces]MCX5051710.1 right-handed parallel beta-helix repeat-containing protein [Streptomyces sp. NBC_00474]